MKKQAKAKLSHLRIAPRKVRLLIGLIRGLSVEDAIIQLEQSKKNASRSVLKLLQSAVANAVHNHKIKEDTLRIETAFVDGGPMLKRWKPRAFGRAAPIRKRSSHVTIILEGEASEDKKDKKESVSAKALANKEKPKKKVVKKDNEKKETEKPKTENKKK